MVKYYNSLKELEDAVTEILTHSLLEEYCYEVNTFNIDFMLKGENMSK